MKKASEVFKKIRFAKYDPIHDKGHKGGSTDDEEHGAIGEKEYEQQVAHVKKRAMQEETNFLDESKKKKEDEKLPSMETSFGSHSKKDEKLPSMETSFGSHSKEDDKLPSMKTSFGSHSKKLKEDLEFFTEAKEPKTVKDQIGKDNHELHKTDKLKVHEDLIGYTAGSSSLNDFLHKHYNGKNTKNSQPLKNIKRVKGMDSVLDNASLSKDTHVFTGLPQGPHELFKRHGIEKGENLKVHLPAYTSTSTEYSRAKKFASDGYDRSNKFGDHMPVDHSVHEPLNELNEKQLKKIKSNSIDQKHVLKIHLPKGTKAGSVKHFSQYSHENEILLHRGHNLEIHHRPTVDPDGTHIWHARIIGHSPSSIEKDTNKLKEEVMSEEKKLSSACWRGYEAIGMKMKNGKRVPNCVPVKEDIQEQIQLLDEMPGANMDTRAVHSHLKKRGWKLTRTSGGHDVFTHPDAEHHIAVPRHRQLKAPLVKGILKQAAVSEEVEQLDEISDKTLQSYRQQAHTQIQHYKYASGKDKPEAAKVLAKREPGMATATRKVMDKQKQRIAAQPKVEPQKAQPYKPLGGRDELSGRSYNESYEPSRMLNIAKSAARRNAGIKEQADEGDYDTPAKKTLSRTAGMVKDLATKAKDKKVSKGGNEKFQPDPEISTQIMRQD